MTREDDLLARIRSINADISIRPAGAADAAAYAELMNSQYRRKRNPDHFRWQFADPSIPARLVVACHGDVLAGCYGVQVHRLSNGLDCGFAVDLLIAPQFRNRGLFALLERDAMEYCESRLCVAVAVLPNALGMKAHAGLKDWRTLGTVKTLGLSASPNRQEFHPSVRPGEGRAISFAKDASYRQWRYDRHPSYSYDRVRLPSGEFVVTKLFVDPVTGGRYGDIVDFECDPNDPGKMADLFRHTCDVLSDRSVECITTWGLPHSGHFSVLTNLGFREQDPERYFCVKVLKAGHEYLYDFRNWNLVQADSEIY